MDDTTQTAPEGGGTRWELETAGKQMVAARHAGDVDAEVLAMLRFSEGLRNSSLGVVGQLLVPLDATIKATRADVATVLERQVAVDMRISGIESRVDGLSTLVRNWMATIDRRVDMLHERVDAVESIAARLETIVTHLTPHGYETVMEELQQLEMMMRRLRWKVWLLLVAVGSIIVIFILALALGGGR